jgi:Ca2+-binding EF-hand superfamily protein
LPDGMTLSTGGEVTGTPTETGTFHSLIRVTDALLRTDERVFEVTITEEACLGDIDGDGFIGVEDLLAILASWGACQGCPTDIDGDGLVQVGDLLIVLARWGDCP